LVEANVSEKWAVSVFRAEDLQIQPFHMAEMETAHFSEMLASTNQSTWQLNPKVHHQKCVTVVCVPFRWAIKCKNYQNVAKNMLSVVI
jgi:hypothetical protein